MKIAHVINSLNRGGAESHLLELVTAQANSGIIVDVIVIGHDSPNIFSINSELSKVSGEIYRLKGPRMFNLFSYIKLQKIIKKNSYDVIHSHQPRSDYMIYLIKKLIFPKNNFKWIVSIHGKYDSYLDNNYKKIFKLYFFKKLVKSWNLADSVIVISNEVEAWLENHTKEIKPHVINYWISSKDYKPIDLNSSINIGFLGRLNKNKGIEDLIESLNGLNLDLNLIIGGFGSDNYINFLYKERYFLEQDYMTLLEVDNNYTRASSSLLLLINIYTPKFDIPLVPNIIALLSAVSLFINRTELWGIFIAKYSPSITDAIFGYGPHQLSNYLYDHRIRLDVPEYKLNMLYLPHSSLLDSVLFFGITI